MASLPAAANVVKVQLNGISGSSKAANVFHLKYTGAAPSPATLATLSAAVAAAFLTRFGALVSNTFAWKTFIAVDLSSITSSRQEGSLSGSGSAAGTAPPGQVACVISWSINSRYRGGHPRTYVAGIPDSQRFDSNTWATAFLGSMATAATNFMGDCNALTSGGATWQLGSVNYWTYGARPPALRPTPQWFPYIGATIHPRIDSQRRRLGKEPI